MSPFYKNPDGTIASNSGGYIMEAPTQEEFEDCCCVPLLCTECPSGDGTIANVTTSGSITYNPTGRLVYKIWVNSSATATYFTGPQWGTGHQSGVTWEEYYDGELINNGTGTFSVFIFCYSTNIWDIGYDIILTGKGNPFGSGTINVFSCPSGHPIGTFNLPLIVGAYAWDSGSVSVWS